MYEPDEFEKRFARGEGEVYFRDKVPPPKYLFAFMAMGMVAFAAGVFSSLPWTTALPMLIFGALFVFFGNLAASGYRVLVSDAGIDAYMGLARTRIPLDDITHMEVAQAVWTDYPMGKTVRRNRSGKAYMPGLDRFDGVKVHRKSSGLHVFLPTSTPDRLIESVERAQAIARGEDVVLGLEPEERELEEVAHIEEVG